MGCGEEAIIINIVNDESINKKLNSILVSFCHNN